MLEENDRGEDGGTDNYCDNNLNNPGAHFATSAGGGFAAPATSVPI